MIQSMPGSPFQNITKATNEFTSNFTSGGGSGGGGGFGGGSGGSGGTGGGGIVVPVKDDKGRFDDGDIKKLFEFLFPDTFGANGVEGKLADAFKNIALIVLAIIILAVGIYKL